MIEIEKPRIEILELSEDNSYGKRRGALERDMGLCLVTLKKSIAIFTT